MSTEPDPIYGPFRWRYLVFACGVLLAMVWLLHGAVQP